MATEMEVIPDNTNSQSNAIPPVIYRCKKCRRIVATADVVIPHKRGEGQKCFRTRRCEQDKDLEQSECSSIFVEPVKWMQVVVEGCIGDKLQCGGCKARLGNFSWVGMQCSCGTWVYPAFQLHKSRMDECPV